MNLISIGKPEVVSRKLPSLSDLHGVACNSLRMSAFRSSSFAGRARHARAISRSCALSSTSSWPSSSFFLDKYTFSPRRARRAGAHATSISVSSFVSRLCAQCPATVAFHVSHSEIHVRF